MLVGQVQPGSGSPYSAYGLGELNSGTQVSQTMMGGLGVAVVDPVSLVSANPASYAAMQRTMFEMGIVVRSSQFTSGDRSATGRRTDLLGWSLGVPFGKGRGGMGLGLNPVSNVAYNISTTAPLATGEGDLRYEYTGNGGLNKAFLGFGWTALQKRDSLNNGYRFSLGANLGYVFGSIEQTRKAIYPAGRGYYNSSATSSLVLRDPVADVGLHFQGDLRRRKTSKEKNLYYLVGVTADMPVALGARRTDLVNSFGVGSSGVEFPIDTSFFADGTKGSLALPVGFGVGFTVFDQHWAVSAEVRQRDWRQLRVRVEGYELPSELAQNISYALGASFRPAKEVGGTFWQRTIYRAGVRYNQDYLVVGGKQLTEVGVSGGMSFPLMGSSTRSRFNIGAEYSDRGSTENGLVRQRSASVFVGITITPDVREQWFKKRRID